MEMAQAHMVGTGGGSHVYIEPCKELEAVGKYLAKYLTKEMLLSAPKRCRRVTVSRGLKLNDKPTDATTKWQIMKAAIESLLAETSGVVEESYSDRNCKVLEGFVVELTSDELGRFVELSEVRLRYELRRRELEEGLLKRERQLEESREIRANNFSKLRDKQSLCAAQENFFS